MGIEPLVSIVVVTYNSSKTILETLDSVLAQTYQNIELIVSDDCSKDDTVEKCKTWADVHDFKWFKILTTPVNTGLSLNINRGCKAANGSWIKTIAGDDVLTPNSISDYVSFVTNRSDVHICCGQCIPFGDNPQMKVDNIARPTKNMQYIYDLSVEEQLKELLQGNIVFAPTLFYSKYLWEKVRFDEQYKFVEDYPFLIHCLQQGYKIYFFPHVTCKYRISENSLSRSKGLYSQRLLEMETIFYFKELKPLLLKYGMSNHIFKWESRLLVWMFASVVLKNKNNKINRLAIKVFKKLFLNRFFQS